MFLALHFVYISGITFQ